MKINSELKEEAKSLLKKNSSIYGYSLIIVGVAILSSFFPNNSWFFMIILWILGLQLVKFSLETINNKENINFFDFSKTLRAIKINLWKLLYCSIGLIISFFGFLLMIISNINIYKNSYPFNDFNLFYFLCSVLLILSGLIYYFYQSYNYEISTYMAFDERFDELSELECVKKSSEMIYGNRMKFFILDISFVLWFLLGFITCSLSYIYVFPYYYLTLCLFYFDIINNSKFIKDKIITEELITEENNTKE